MELIIYTLLAVLASVYAYILDRVRTRIEPDLTWLEVAIGCALCLLAPTILARLTPNVTWSDYEQWTWLAFVVGGLPIVVWQFDKTRRNIAAIRDAVKKELTNANTTAEMAEPRREQ